MSFSHSGNLDAIFPLSNDVKDRLNLYVDRLIAWQKKTNLIAPSTLDDIWNRHIADSLQLLAIKPDARNWLDLGSGGGFPGLVIAAIMADYPESKVTLVESNNKKTAFLRQVNRQMGGKANIITGRIEQLDLAETIPEIVTARALAAMPLLFELSEKWLTKGAVALFHKGKDFQSELSECDGLWDYDLLNHVSRISSESVILEITELKRKT